jgi:hypothetical protein
MTGVLALYSAFRNSGEYYHCENVFRPLTMYQRMQQCMHLDPSSELVNVAVKYDQRNVVRH